MQGITDRLMQMIAGRSVESPSVPLTPDNLLASMGSNRGQAAGVSVNRLTAMGIPALFNGVRIYSGAIARLPLCVKKVTDQGKVDYKTHPAYRLLHSEASEHTTAFVLRRRLVEDVLLEGNGYAYIYRDNGGRPMRLRRLDPAVTWPVVEETLNSAGIPVETRVRYVTNFSTNLDLPGSIQTNTPYRRATLPGEDVIHIRGVGPTEFQGYPVLYLLAESVGMSVAHLQYSSSFFANNATPNIVLTLPFQLQDEQQIERFRKSWNNAHRGSKNQHKIGILEGGADVKPLSIDPEKSQLLQSMQHDTVQIANIVNLPADLLGAETNTSYNSLEQTNRNTLTYRFAEMLENIEAECNMKLLTERERNAGRYEFQHDKTVMERPDRKTEVETDVMMINNGVRSVDEIRRKDGMPPLEGDVGRLPRMPVNIGFAEKIMNPLEPEPMPAPAPSPEPVDEEPENDSSERFRHVASVMIRKHFDRYAKQVASKLKKPESIPEWLDNLADREAKAVAADLGVSVDLAPYFQSYRDSIEAKIAEGADKPVVELVNEWRYRAADEILELIGG
jgi:HK97 family phage portal protein